jgi:hypothetical protein
MRTPIRLGSGSRLSGLNLAPDRGSVLDRLRRAFIRALGGHEALVVIEPGAKDVMISDCEALFVIEPGAKDVMISDCTFSTVPTKRAKSAA